MELPEIIKEKDTLAKKGKGYFVYVFKKKSIKNTYLSAVRRTPMITEALQ